MTIPEACLLAMLLPDNDVRLRGAIAETNKTGLTCLHLRHRSVKAVVGRDTTLMVACNGAFE